MQESTKQEYLKYDIMSNSTKVQYKVEHGRKGNAIVALSSNCVHVNKLSLFGSLLSKCIDQFESVISSLRALLLCLISQRFLFDLGYFMKETKMIQRNPKLPKVT